MNEQEIRQLIDPGQWQATFRDTPQRPLVGWALVESGDIVGLVTYGVDVVRVDGIEDFSGYWHPGR